MGNTMLPWAGRSAMMELCLVWPTRVRHRELKHAFEEALDEAGLQTDGDLEDFVDAALSNPAQAPGMGSLGEITVAANEHVLVSVHTSPHLAIRYSTVTSGVATATEP